VKEAIIMTGNTEMEGNTTARYHKTALYEWQHTITALN
jgi:recombinational DNA repair protein RecR